MKKDNDICFRITVKDPELQKMLDDLAKQDRGKSTGEEIHGKNSQERIAELDEQNIEPQKLYRIMKKPTPTFWICASIIFVGLLMCGTYYLVNKDNGRYQYERGYIIDKQTGDAKKIIRK